MASLNNERIQVQLVDPCESTSLIATTIPSQTLFKWNFLNNLAISLPYAQFNQSLLGVDCGAVTYAITADQSVLSKSIGSSTIEIAIDDSAIPDGLSSTFTLTGTL